MRNRFAAVIAAPAALSLTVALGACGSSSTINGQGVGGPSGSKSSSSSSSSTGSGSSQGASSSTSSPPTSSSSSASPSVSLAARLAKGLTQAKTAHLSLNISAAGQLIAGSGDESLSNGKLVALDLSETVTKSLALRLIIVGGKSYVRLPSSINRSGKPWQLVSAKSSDATIRQLAASLASTQSSASLASVTAFVSAARSVKQTGTSTYAVDVDPSKLPSSFEGKQALIQSGLTSIPISIRLDSAGRPTLVTEKLSVEGQKVSTKITIGSYNKPVHITAPPASQVSTR